MSVFEYVALDEKGREKKGFIDAAGLSAARQQLREEGVYPVEIKPAVQKKETVLSGIMDINLWQRVSAKEISVFTRQLSTLLSAGIPLVSSFSILLGQTKNPMLRKILAQIRADLTEGKSLTASMESFPRVFEPFYVNMIKAGEASGTINIVLERLADFSENQQTLLSNIRSLLIYPAIMFLVGTLVIFFMMTYVVPQITEIFSDMHQTLPLITVILIAISDFLKVFWWLVLLLLAAAIIVFKYLTTKTDGGRRWWDAVCLKAPVFGTINLKIAIARFSRTLATLLQSGVPLLAAMDIVRNVVGNVFIGETITEAAKAVEEGQSLAGPLAQSGIFPTMVTEMIAVGEQSGSLEKMLNRVANAYETEAQADTLAMTSLLGPMTVLGMGLVVLFIVVAILLPIFEMNQLIK